MKNKYLTKCLCITLISAMVLSGTSVVMAAESGEAQASDDIFGSGDGEGDFTDVPAPTQAPAEPETPNENEASPAPEQPVDPAPEETPSPTPGETAAPTPGETETPSPTPGETETPAPTPGETAAPAPGETESPTPTPGVTETPTPTPGDIDILTPEPTPDVGKEKVQRIIEEINSLALEKITLDHKARIEDIRNRYNALSEEEKALVTNYESFVAMEKQLKELIAKSDKDKEADPIGDGTDSNVDALIGSPIYYTNMVSNLHAGKEFYLNSLKNNYQLTFSEDFASVMEEIENEYKVKNNLVDTGAGEDLTDSDVTTSADSLLVRNWQDILAVYIYEQHENGAESYTLDASSKEALAEIFAEMNPVIHDKEDSTKVGYANRHVNYYIKKNQIPKENRAILNKYLETDCKLLCATVTASKGFVRQSVGDEVSEERVNVIAAAYSLIGKVGYFWGGKSTTIGEDPSWGTVAAVTAEGSKSTGTLRAYGLDCSGFVTWSVINGYENQSMGGSVGNGTSEQWENAHVISEADAQPGDLVFQRGPESGSDNHVGILCGKTDAGDWIAVHCSSSQNGVTVGEAYSASFRYIRQPSFYPTQEQLEQIRNQTMITDAVEDDVIRTDAAENAAIETAEFVSSNASDLAEALGDIVSDTGVVDGDITDSGEDTVIIYQDNVDSIISSGNILIDDNEIEVFDMDDGEIESFELVMDE